MRRRLIIGALAALVLAIAGVAAVVLIAKHRGRDVVGSSTVEFNPGAVPTITAPPATTTTPTAPAKPGIVWPTFAYDNERLHTAPSTFAPPYRVSWTAGGGTLLEFPPAIAFGRLFLENGAGQFFAIDTKTGHRAWTYRTGRCVAASPAVGRYGGGTIYETFLNRRPCNSSQTTDGVVVALSAGTGHLRWQRAIGPSESSPLLAGNHLYVGDWLGNVYSLDARTGRIEWTYHTGGKVKGAVAIHGGTLYIGSYDGHLYALDAATGALRWRASGDPRLLGSGTFYSTPAVAYDRVYIGSTDGKLYSFGASSGERRWSHSTGGYIYGSPAVDHQRVFVGSYDHDFYAFDAATGNELWRFQANGPISGSATVLGRYVYFATLSGRTYALDKSTGKLAWSYPDGKYTPIVADSHHLYLVGNGKLYALTPRR